MRLKYNTKKKLTPSEARLGILAAQELCSEQGMNIPSRGGGRPLVGRAKRWGRTNSENYKMVKS